MRFKVTNLCWKKGEEFHEESTLSPHQLKVFYPVVYECFTFLSKAMRIEIRFSNERLLVVEEVIN